MDPNAALARVRHLVLEIGRTLDHDQAPDMATVNDLCEAIDGLDQWISRGGFLPTPWVPQPAPGTGEAISSDAALAQLRTAMSVYEDVRGNGTGCHLVDKSADQMRDAGRSLDDWLTRGGSLPEPWARNRG